MLAMITMIHLVALMEKSRVSETTTPFHCCFRVFADFLFSCYQAIIYRIGYSDKQYICTGEDDPYMHDYEYTSQTSGQWGCTTDNEDCVPGKIDWDSEEEEVISTE